MTLSDNARGVLYMNIAMLAFTVNDSFMKTALKTVPLFQAIGLRGAITTLALLAIGLMLGGMRLWPQGRDMRLLLIRSLAEVGGTLFFLMALRHMQLATLSAILQSLPLAVTLAAALIFGDKIGWRRLTAIIVGFVGVTIIIRPGTGSFDIWSVLGLASVACVVIRDLSTRAMSRDLPSVSVAIWAAATVALLGGAGITVTGWQPITMADTMLILAAAACLIVGYLFIVSVMRVGEFSVIAPFRYTALLWAILLGYFMFGTLPDDWTLVGAAIVVATGVFTLYREGMARRRAGQAAT